MKITLWPKTNHGKTAAMLSIIFIVSILLKMGPGFPLPTFAIAGLGAAGFVVGIIAIIKKDRSIGSFFAILVGLVIIIVFVAVGISAAGLFKDFPVKDSLSQTEAGDTSDKVMNLGQISQSGGWIYYVYDANLYKRKTDWTERTKISDDEFYSIYIFDGWIYYTDSVDVSNLCKMKTDGSGQVKISDDIIRSFVISGDWIFYTTKKSMLEINELKKESKDFSEMGGALYRVKTDGSEKMKLADVDFEFGGLKVLGEWVYYSDIGNLLKIRTDGTEQTLVAEDAGIEYVSGDWLYYLIKSPEKQGLEKITIYRIKADGTEKSVTATLSGVYGYYFDSDWFYYTPGKGLSRIKLDGTGKEKLNDISIWSLMGVSGDWMYIADYGGPMFRVKLDGSVGTRIK
ncbi:MAG: DUF5050 domain-containing protein [Lutispora sp.]|nr:DUF5050 domain-containing protein [Lutispora sp.]